MRPLNALLLARNSDKCRAYLLGFQTAGNVHQNDQSCCLTSANPRRSDICGRDSVYRLALPRPCTIFIRHSRITTTLVALDENSRHWTRKQIIALNDLLSAFPSPVYPPSHVTSTPWFTLEHPPSTHHINSVKCVEPSLHDVIKIWLIHDIGSLLLLIGIHPSFSRSPTTEHEPGKVLVHQPSTALLLVLGVETSDQRLVRLWSPMVIVPSSLHRRHRHSILGLAHPSTFMASIRFNLFSIRYSGRKKKYCSHPYVSSQIRHITLPYTLLTFLIDAPTCILITPQPSSVQSPLCSFSSLG